jgi:hypothetical protein
VTITYFFEDNSISVIREPETANSGMTQGLLIRRTRKLMDLETKFVRRIGEDTGQRTKE